MSFAYSHKNKKVLRAGDKLSNNAEKINQNILALAGKTPGKGRDPVYCAMSDFSKEFDAVGMSRIREIRNNELPEKNHPQSGNKDGKNKNQSTGFLPEKEQELRRKHDSPAYTHSSNELANGNFCDRFSSYAFNKGKLAASVMAGRGEIMLTSCLKRAAGGSSRFSGSLSDRTPIKGKSASLVTGKDVETAVGLVTDSTRSAGRLLELMKSLVNGDGQAAPQMENGEFMQRIYPFLRTDGEDKIIYECKNRLRSFECDYSPQAIETRKTLKSALRKASAVKERKILEQRNLLTKLTEIQNNVKAAEKLFSSDGYATALTEQLQKELEGSYDSQSSAGGEPPYPSGTALDASEEYENTENESKSSNETKDKGT